MIQQEAQAWSGWIFKISKKFYSDFHALAHLSYLIVIDFVVTFRAGNLDLDY